MSSLPAHTSTNIKAWRVVGAAVRGVSHERMDLPCQDAFGYRMLPGGELLVAVADGAGSARFSDEGARAAVETVLGALEQGIARAPYNLAELVKEQPVGERSELALFDEPEGKAEEAGVPNEGSIFLTYLMLEAFGEARDAVLRAAEEAGESAREYACTLTCAVAGSGWLTVCQIGDGAVVMAKSDGELACLTQLQRGEYANETHFLVQADALDQAEIQVTVQNVHALAVMSDGLIRLALKMPSQEPHEPFFRPLFAFVQSADAEDDGAARLAGFLASERVNARTDDDKSLVLAVRLEPEMGRLEE